MLLGLSLCTQVIHYSMQKEAIQANKLSSLKSSDFFKKPIYRIRSQDAQHQVAWHICIPRVLRAHRGCLSAEGARTQLCRAPSASGKKSK
jgi:hypothetical protein